MAFPIPSHLPRKGNPQDISTRVLSTISETTVKSLNSQLAATWVAELDDAILSTKKRIHDRIHANLPAFERQLATSKSIQERLHSLTSNVDDLSRSLSDSESGLIPKLLVTLTSHATLAQEASDAEIRLLCLRHLLECRTKYDALASLVQDGKLPEAVEISSVLERLVDDAPVLLGETEVLSDLKRKFRALKNQTVEQLDDAYARSISITPTEIVIRPSVRVRQSNTFLSSSSIFASLSPNPSSLHISALRRDITTHYIDLLLQQPASIITSESHDDDSGSPECRLSLIPSPPNSESLSSRLGNLSATLDFLNENLFSALTSTQSSDLCRSLCRPLTTATLNLLLIPHLPSSLAALPAFLDLVNHAVAFEDKYLIGMLDQRGADREIKAWSAGIGGHYERKRRTKILDRARWIVLAEEDETKPSVFRAEVEVKVVPEVIPVQAESAEEGDDEAWGLEEDVVGADEKVEGEEKVETPVDENGWGFDDEVDEPEPEPEPENGTNGKSPAAPAEEEDAWGWNDEEEQSTTAVNETPWDDLWDDDDAPPLPPPTQTAKPATRLEKKFSKKGKNGVSGGGGGSESTFASPVQSPVPPGSARFRPEPAFVPPPSHVTAKRPEKLSVPPVSAPPVKESYLVSNRVKEIVMTVEDVLNEGREFAASKIFPSNSSSSPPGTILFQCAPAVLDLYRALYPVRFSSGLESSPAWSMRFCNDCSYLSGKIDCRGATGSVRDGLSNCKDHLRVYAESLFEDNIDRQRQVVDDLLSQAEGFVETGDQEQFDECESIVTRVLQQIRRVAHQWKPVLTKNKYYVAVGSLVDAALSRMMEDILALPDIPEVESHKLSELCKILNALEGLFVEDPDEPSVVVAYVPSWLKFSYLSELLEASIADISYLFEEGALVDFELDELVKLVQALFADTQLRTNTINKIMAGHPVRE